MTTMTLPAIWTAIVVAGVGTFLIRYSFLGMVSDRTEIPPLLQTALTMVPAAVMAALVAPALLRRGGTIDVTPDNLRLIAGIVAGVAAWKAKSMLATIGVGMVALWLLQWLV